MRFDLADRRWRSGLLCAIVCGTLCAWKWYAPWSLYFVCAGLAVHLVALWRCTDPDEARVKGVQAIQRHAPRLPNWIGLGVVAYEQGHRVLYPPPGRPMTSAAYTHHPQGPRTGRYQQRQSYPSHHTGHLVHVL